MIYFKNIVICVFLLISYFSTYTFAQFGDEVEIPAKIVSFEFRVEPEKPRPGEHARIIPNHDLANDQCRLVSRDEDGNM